MQGHLSQRGEQPCLHLTLPDLQPLQLAIFDQRGQCQWQQAHTPHTRQPVLTWPGQHLPPGLYTVVVRQQGQTRTWRWLAP